MNLGCMHHRQMLYHRTTVLAVAFGFWKWGLGPCCPVAQTSPTPSLLNNWTMVVQHSDLLATFLINKSMSKTWEKVEQSLGQWAVHAWTLECEGRVVVDTSFICLLLPSTGSHCLFSSQVREVVGRGPVFQGYSLAPGSCSLLSAPDPHCCCELGCLALPSSPWWLWNHESNQTLSPLFLSKS